MLENITVLIIDDDTFILDLLAEILNSLRVNCVLRAQDGQQALAILSQANRVDVVISDLMMPQMDGVEFFRYLAQMAFKPPIIICSGTDPHLENTVKSLLQAHQLNYAAMLRKPVTKEALMNALVNCLRKPRFNGDKPLTITVQDIRQGLTMGQFEVVYQPKVSSIDKRLCGAEALLRWQHPAHGFISPEQFIPLAEEGGYIDDLTLFVFRQAALQQRRWREQGLTLPVSVNISMDNLTRLDLPEEFEAICKGLLIETNMVTLEMTESRLLANMATSLDIIARLRLKGFGMAIDDFGTGYASLAKLQQLPFTELKIDRGFILGVAEDLAKKNIMNFSVEIGRSLGLKIVAEGVETQNDLEMAVNAGCHELQGYLISRPIRAEELFVWAKSWDGPIKGSNDEDSELRKIKVPLFQSKMWNS